jgi:hypothetical protein
MSAKIKKAIQSKGGIFAPPIGTIGNIVIYRRGRVFVARAIILKGK